MEKMQIYFHKLQQKHPTLKADLTTILSTRKRPQDGMTIAELKEAYWKYTSTKFPIGYGTIAVVEFLLTIPFIAIFCNSRGTHYFYYMN